MGNEVMGPIPAELGDLANLEGLFLSRNALTGSIPAELGNLAVNGRRKVINSRQPSVRLSPASDLFLEILMGRKMLAVGAVGNRVLGGFPSSMRSSA